MSRGVSWSPQPPMGTPDASVLQAGSLMPSGSNSSFWAKSRVFIPVFAWTMADSTCEQPEQ